MNVSEKLREALERLDQAIDRLDANAAAGGGQAVPAMNGASTDYTAVAAKLDRMIQRIETALAN